MRDPFIIYMHLAQPLTDDLLKEACEMGMMSQSDLRDGVVYSGFCRNARCAQWDASQDLFWYHRDRRRETVPYAADSIRITDPLFTLSNVRV